MSVLNNVADASAMGLLKKQVRRRTRHENWNDPTFATHASALYEHFRIVGKSPSKLGEPEVGAYLELVRMDWGLEAVVIAANRLLDLGISPEVLASAVLQSCQAGNDHPRAERFLGVLYANHPSKAIVALRYGQALAALGEWAKLDSLARETAYSIIYGPWATEQWARLLLNSCRFESAELFVAKMGNKPDVQNLFTERIRSFQQGAGLFPFSTWLINLDREPRKLKLSTELLSKGGFRPQRLRAVDARQLPTYSHRKLGASPEVLATQGAGAIATALSHISAWEALLASTMEVAFIVEDDAVPFVHWKFHEKWLALAPEYDLLWVNERMSLSHAETSARTSEIESPWTVLAHRPEFYNGIGADGYLISRRGAEKFLTLFDRDGIQGHVDWQMGAYSLGNRTDKPTSESQRTAERLRNKLSKNPEMRSMCLTFPLVSANDHGVSNTTDISREYKENSIRKPNSPHPKQL